MQPSLLHDGSNQSLTYNTRIEEATSPQSKNTNPRKCEANFRSDVFHSVGVRLSAFFANLGFDLFQNARCWLPSTIRSSKNHCVQAAVFSFADSLFALISLDALVVFVCIFYGLRAALRVRVENLHIEESATKAGALQTVCLALQSSVIISSGGNTRESFSWSFGSIWTSWQTSSIRFANTSLLLFCRRCVYPPLAQKRAWVRLNSFPNVHMAGVFFASQF